MSSVWDMIENVRQKPETVRRRYMYVWVGVTMLLVFGIWFLSVTESFHTVATEAPELKDQAAQIVPKPDTSSLSGLLEQGKSLQVDDARSKAEDFFETQLQPTTGTPAQESSREVK